MRLRDLPGFPALFADFIEGSGSAREFFPWPPDANSLRERVRSIPSQAVPRQELCDWLSHQEELFQGGPSASSGIVRLQNPGCVAVVASMPPALLGGSLCSWLKIVTAVQLAAWIEEQGTPAAAVLWIRSGTGSGKEEIGLPTPFGPQRFNLARNRAAGSTIPEGITELLARTAQALHVDLEDSDLMRGLTEAYTPGADFSTAWARMISGLFGSQGVVLVDPRQPGMDSLSRHLKKIFDIKVLRNASAEGERRLEALGYFPGETEEERLAEAESPRMNGEWSGQEARILNRMAPFVAQSLLLPVAVNVLDEEDMFLCARNYAIFERFSLPPPPAWPRTSATILDYRSRALLARHGLRLEDLFAGAERISERILTRLDAQGTLRSLDELEAGIENDLSELAQFVPTADRLSFEIGKSRTRIIFQIEKLRQRFQTARQRQVATVARQVSRLCNALAPRGRLQEREFAGFAFALQASRRLPHVLAERVDPWEFEHQLISLE